MSSLLTKTTLSQINAEVTPVQYDLDKATCGIVHIGIGAFHRAHQAVYTDDLLATGDLAWKITAVSLRSANIRSGMAPQDNLYSVTEKSPQGETTRLIGAIDQVLVAPENPQQVIDVLASSNTKVVTLTVTEKGYCRDKSGQQLDVDNPVIVADLADLSAPKSLPGFIVAACKERQQSGEKLTIVSCDNLPSNGDVTRNVVMGFAEQVDSELAKWIASNVSFCNSMVDRIVPATTEADIDHVATKLGLLDNSAVITEPFKQWIIEDNFINDKPAWDKVGALFVKDVTLYEEMKLRLLNGAHSALAYTGFLLGYEFIHQAVSDNNCLAFARELHQQLLTTLGDVPGINLAEYAELILTRFANNEVPYKTSQVASDGSQKLPQRLVSASAEILAKGGDYSAISLVLACWCRYLEGVDVSGNSYEINDPMAEKLNLLAVADQGNAQAQVLAILGESGVCSKDLLANSDFVASIVELREAIDAKGLAKTLADFLASK